jgi:hypothetical protein
LLLYIYWLMVSNIFIFHFIYLRRAGHAETGRGLGRAATWRRIRDALKWIQPTNKGIFNGDNYTIDISGLYIIYI